MSTSLGLTSTQQISLRDSTAYCRAVTRRAAQNFHFSFLTLPAAQYNAMCALYAFMRQTDDLADDISNPVATRQRALQEWRSRLESTVAGDLPPGDPLWPAVAEMIDRYQVPPKYLFDVITGVELDLQPVAMPTFADLERYCYHVAGAVGLCCIHIWGFRSEAAIPLAIQTGQALQLTNILRDVAEDAQLGRTYLPEDDLARFGVQPTDLRQGPPTPAVRQLLACNAERARESYAQAEQLFAELEPTGRPILRAMLSIYGGLLDEIVRRDFDVFATRVRIPRWRKLWFAVHAWWTERGR